MLPSMEKKKPSADIQLPPGFRFHPSDEELIIHYLKNKVTSNPLPASIIADIDLYKYNPWELPKKALFGEEEWYFFTPRDRKYPNGVKPNRAAASGFWKSTGTDKPIFTSCGTKSIGVKKALVFYKGRPPKGYKTDWIMHEYRLLDNVVWTPKREGSMRLDDWVMCRVRLKSGNTRITWEDGERNVSSYDSSGFVTKVNELWSMNTDPNIEMVKSYLYNDCPMLPYIFASQDFPNSSLSFQGNDNQKENLQFSVSNYFDSLFGPLKRKLMEEDQNQKGNLSKKIKEANVHQKEENMLSVISNDGAVEMNIYKTDKSEGNNFSEDHQWCSIMQYHQELNN